MSATKESGSKAATRNQWRDKPLPARLKRIAAIFVEHAAVKNLLAHIETQLMMAEARRKSSGTLVIAESGAGKSTFIKYLKAKYPDSCTPEVQFRPVVHFKVPSSPTPKQMGAAFLKALGDPLAKVGTAEEKMSRIGKLIETCQTRIIAIDDFQDVPARRGSQGVKAVGDWVRDVFEMEFTGTLLAFGTQQAAVVRDSNEQLGRRMMARMELPVFEIQTSTGSDTFRSLLSTIDAQLPLAEDSGLAKPDFMARIFFACAGNLDYLMKLLCHAVARAVQGSREHLELQDLEHAFTDLHQVAARHGNPFSQDYDGRPLDKPGQVFHRVDPEDHQHARKPSAKESKE
jgi:hypothetical protein